MSTFYDVTSAERWAVPTKSERSGFVRTGAAVFSQSSPTGDPLDTYHAQYPKTPLTLQFGSDPPVLEFTAFSWAGTQGGVLAAPTWTWKSTSAPASLLKYSILQNGTLILGPLTIAANSTTVSTSTLPTIGGYTYQIVLVATNAGGSSTFTSTAQYNSDTTATFSSFSWAGGIGTLTAQPTWTWTVASSTTPPSTPATLTFQLFADTSATPTTLISSGSLPAGYGVPSTLSYVFSGATLLNRYYKLNLTCNGVLSFTNTQQNLSSLTLPVITPESFVWTGTVGSTSAAPKWTWLSTGGVADSITASIYGDASATPTTLLTTGSGGNSFLTLDYTGATVANYYYKITVNAENGIGNATPVSDTQQNVLAAPTATLATSGFDGTQGGTSSLPYWTWTYGGGTPASYAWTVYGDTSATPTTVLDSGTSSITSYQYTGVTVNGYYYKLSVTAMNAGGSGSFSDTLNNTGPIGVSVGAESIGTGTAAAPAVTAASVYATSVQFQLYQSKTSTNPGALPSGGYTLIATSTNSSPTGYDSYSYPGSTIVTRWYRYLITATNSLGSATAQTSSLQCNSS